MSRLNSLLRRLASPADKELLDRNPSRGTQLRIVGRIGLRFWWAYLVLLVLFGAGTVSAGMDMYHRTESPSFCGACHEMSTNFGTWSESSHKNITCADCHSRPGVGGWVMAKTAGVKQLAVHFTAKNITGIKLEEGQRKIITDNCTRCHRGVARVGERLGLGVSHRQHLDKGMDCMSCHTGSFTHPKPKAGAADGGVADGGSPAAEGDKGEGDKGPSELEILEARFVEVAECYKCHDGKNVLSGKTAFNALDEKNCLKCHPDADQALAHGARHASAETRKPCLDCHAQAEGKAHFTMEGPVAPMCEKCHEKQKFESRHSPYKKSECEKCHRVMSPAYLFKSGPRPTNGMCLGCHEEMAKLMKADKATGPGQFGLQGKNLHKAHQLELEKSGNDWCFDCHHPHGSDAETAMLKLSAPADAKKPSVLTYGDNGGSCEGGCHEKAKVDWTREE